MRGKRGWTIADLSIERYPIRTCRTLHECDGCGLAITAGQRYYDGGYGRRFHVEKDCAGLQPSRGGEQGAPR